MRKKIGYFQWLILSPFAYAVSLGLELFTPLPRKFRIIEKQHLPVKWSATVTTAVDPTCFWMCASRACRYQSVNNDSYILHSICWGKNADCQNRRSPENPTEFNTTQKIAIMWHIQGPYSTPRRPELPRSVIVHESPTVIPLMILSNIVYLLQQKSAWQFSFIGECSDKDKSDHGRFYHFMQ